MQSCHSVAAFSKRKSMYKVGVRYLMLHVCVSFFFASDTPSASGYPSHRPTAMTSAEGLCKKKKKKENA